jgi:hypothetical protein
MNAGGPPTAIGGGLPGPIGGGPGNCANTSVGAHEIVASATLTDSVKSAFPDMIVSVSDLRFKDRHLRGRRKSRGRRMSLGHGVNRLRHRPAIALDWVDPEPRHIERRQEQER